MKAKVKFLVDHYTYKKDDVDIFNDKTAKKLCDLKIAKLITK